MSTRSFAEVDATLERHTKMVAETWAWPMYLILLDFVEGSAEGKHQAFAAAKVLVAKVAALEPRR